MNPYDPHSPADYLAADPTVLANYLAEIEALINARVGQEIASYEAKRIQRRTDRIPEIYAGGSALISAATQEETVLSVSSEIMKEVDSSPFFLVFDVSQDAASANLATDDHRPQARILWGSPKGRCLGAIDLVNGASIEIESTSSVQVTASMSGFNLDDEFSYNAIAITTSPILRVTASVFPGGQGKPRSNTFTDFLRAVGAGATVVAPVPRYANQVEIHHAGNPFAAIPQDLELGFAQSVAGAAPARTVTGLRDIPITIPTGTQAVQLTNLSANPLNVQLVYHLAI